MPEEAEKRSKRTEAGKALDRAGRKFRKKKGRKKNRRSVKANMKSGEKKIRNCQEEML